ncbi:MAG: tyrosine-type recombinase/integrase, partial [Promethearchaeota archaeon]
MTKRTSIQSKNKTLQDYIDYYEICNRSEGKSPKTISWYSANLRCFCQYLKRRRLSESVDTIDMKLLREYVIHLLKRKRFEDHAYAVADSELLAPATVHGHVRTLRAFFAWLSREGFIGENKADGLKPPKVPRKIISMISDEEIAAIFRTFNTRESCDMRNQAIFMILID